MSVDNNHRTDSPVTNDVNLPEHVDADLLGALVFVLAPRLFAVVAETADPADINIAAWGLQFDDEVVVIGCDGRMFGTFSSLDRVLWLFSYLDATVRIVWYSQPQITRPHQARRRITRFRR